MKNDLIEICGITSPKSFPQCEVGCPCTELCETDKLFIPSEKPSMEDILQVFVKIHVESYKIICTPIGEKLVIKGCKCIKVMYTAKDICQTVHTAHFEVPFCTFILLKKHMGKIIDISTAVEYVDVCPLNQRTLYVSTIIFLCPDIKNSTLSCESKLTYTNDKKTITSSATWSFNDFKDSSDD